MLYMKYGDGAWDACLTVGYYKACGNKVQMFNVFNASLLRLQLKNGIVHLASDKIDIEIELAYFINWLDKYI